jgi:hypothetical protein
MTKQRPGPPGSRTDSRTGSRTGSKVVATVAALGAVVVLTGAQSSCDYQRSSASAKAGSNGVSAEAKADNGTSSSSASVKYSVSSDASIQSVVFINTDGKQETRSDVGHSWNGTGPHHGRVMVKATSGDGSWIKCSVKAQNKVVQRASATGGGSMTVVCDVTY